MADHDSRLDHVAAVERAGLPGRTSERPAREWVEAERGATRARIAPPLALVAFGAIVPEQITWMPFPAFPPSARLALVVGEPSEPGLYTVRVKVPEGVTLMPHRHPEDRVYTVISGIFYIGLGDRFDVGKLQAYPPGAVVVLPGNRSHFHCARSGEYVTQVTGIGPLGLDYVDPNDDPRSHRD